MTTGSPSAAEIAAATERALRGLQTGIEPVPAADAQPALDGAVATGAGTLAMFLQVFAWILAAAAAVLLVVLALQMLQRRQRRPAAGAAEESDGPGSPDADATAPPASALAAAARGDHGEALRLLLAEVLPRFYRGRGRGWPAAWTSRQCLRQVPAAEPGRADLAALVAAVERHHFGGEPATAEDWDRWRRRGPLLVRGVRA